MSSFFTISCPCFSVQSKMGDLPPMARYCSMIFGVRRLEMYGPCEAMQANKPSNDYLMGVRVKEQETGAKSGAAGIGEDQYPHLPSCLLAHGSPMAIQTRTGCGEARAPSTSAAAPAG